MRLQKRRTARSSSPLASRSFTAAGNGPTNTTPITPTKVDLGTHNLFLRTIYQLRAQRGAGEKAPPAQPASRALPRAHSPV